MTTKIAKLLELEHTPSAGHLAVGHGVDIHWDASGIEIVGQDRVVLTAADALSMRVTRGQRRERRGFGPVLCVELLRQGRRVHRLRAPVDDEATILDGLPWGDGQGADVELAGLVALVQAARVHGARVVEWGEAATERPDALPVHRPRAVSHLSRWAARVGGTWGASLWLAAMALVFVGFMGVSGRGEVLWPVAPGFEATDAVPGEVTARLPRGDEVVYEYRYRRDSQPHVGLTAPVSQEDRNRGQLRQGARVQVLVDERTGASRVDGFELAASQHVEGNPWLLGFAAASVLAGLGLALRRGGEVALLRHGLLAQASADVGQGGRYTFRDHDGAVHELRRPPRRGRAHQGVVIYWPDAPQQARFLNHLPGRPAAVFADDEPTAIAPADPWGARLTTLLAAAATASAVLLVMVTVARYHH